MDEEEFPQRVDSRRHPPLGILIGTAALLHVVTILVDIGLVSGEVVGAVLEPGPISELFLGGAAFFVTNLDIAFSVYVYRVITDPDAENVRLDLNPLDLWGLKRKVEVP